MNLTVRETEGKGQRMLKEFRDFAMKGNVVDLAVGIIIGAAFSGIVTSLVGDIIMPIIGSIGGLDFSNYFTGLSKAVTATNLADAKKQGAVLAWGNFLTLTINFLIVAFVLFMVIRAMNTLKRKDAAAPAAPPTWPLKRSCTTTAVRSSELAGRANGQTVEPRQTTSVTTNGSTNSRHQTSPHGHTADALQPASTHGLTVP